jgi:ADP-ribosyl-[dinitrogen reductase] hydrolase
MSYNSPQTHHTDPKNIHTNQNIRTKPDRFRGCLLGLSVGDAVGTTVEFQGRGSFSPLTDMVGGGPFHLKPGQWTDDTSMALCLATSLVECQGFNADDQMQRYWAWYQEGYLSSTGHCFDIGNTVRQALEQYHRTGNPYSGSTHPRSAGNGCIMRLAPVPLFYHGDLDRAIHFSGESARTTHGAEECIEASRLFGSMLWYAISCYAKAELLTPQHPSIVCPSLQSIARGEYRTKTIDEIRGSGYVVQSLEAALWCFWTTDSFEAAILQAANLGDDADTTAAICGQIAGAYYGESGIPPHWLDRLVMVEDIRALSDRLGVSVE